MVPLHNMAFMNNLLSPPRVFCICIVSILLFSSLHPTRAELSPEAQEAMKKGIMAAKEQEWDIAIQSFQDARKFAPNAPEIYYNLGLAESKMPSRELRAIAWFGAYLAAATNPPNAAAVNDVIAGLQIKNQGNLHRLIKTAQDSARKIPSPAHELREVAVLWTESGDLAAALKTDEFNNDPSAHESLLVAIAKAQAETGDRVGARQTLASARQTVDLIQDAYYKSQSFVEVAETQVETDDFAGAQSTSELIQEPFIRCQSQIAIASAQTKAGDIAGANQTLSSALKSSDLIGPDDTKCEYKIGIAWVQIDTGDFSGARLTLNSARKWANAIPLQTEGAFLICAKESRISEAQVRAGDIPDALETLALVLKTADLVESNYKMQAHRFILDTVNRIVDAQTETGDIAGAQQTANMLQDANSNNYAWYMIVEAQAKAGNISGALKTADMIQDATYKGWALGAVDKAQTKARVFAEVQAKIGDIAGALKTADSIQEAKDKNAAQLAIAEAQAKMGDTAGAENTLARCLETADSIQEGKDKNAAKFADR